MRESIVTNRLILLPPTVDDFDLLAALWTDPSLLRYIGRASTQEEVWVRLLKYSGHWALFGFGYWMLREADSGRFIGEAGVAWQRRTGMTAHDNLPEAGWMLASCAHGKGFAREALGAILDWTEARRGQRGVTCLINPMNAASVRLAESQGFRKFGTTRMGESVVDEFLRP
jgi:RimJ/RimL family protein N-acetyltransferase